MKLLLTSRAAQLIIFVSLAVLVSSFFGAPHDLGTLLFAGVTGFPEIKSAIDAIGQSFEDFKKTNNERLEKVVNSQEDLTNRIEIIESGKGSPGKTGSVTAKLPDGVKIFYTDNGEKIYQLDHKTKIADVIKPDKAPEITCDRWLAAHFLGSKCRDRDAVEFALSKKDMATTTSGVLIPTEYQPAWHDLMRAQSVLNACGMQTLVMNAKTQTHTAVASDPSASWHQESGNISVGDPTFDPRTLTARTLVVRCSGSLELSQDSPNFGQQLMNVMTRAMASEIDRAGLIGSGVGAEPQGIRGAPGVEQLSIGSPSANVGYFGMLAGAEYLLRQNVPIEEATRNVVMSPGLWGIIEGEPTGISGDNTQLPRPRSLQDTAFRVTSALIDAGSPSGDPAFMGDFRELILGTRMEASVEALKLTSYASNLQIEYIGVARVDFMIARPASLVVLEGVQTGG